MSEPETLAATAPRSREAGDRSRTAARACAGDEVVQSRGERGLDRVEGRIRVLALELVGILLQVVQLTVPVDVLRVEEVARADRVEVRDSRHVVDEDVSAELPAAVTPERQQRGAVENAARARAGRREDRCRVVDVDRQLLPVGAARQ